MYCVIYTSQLGLILMSKYLLSRSVSKTLRFLAKNQRYLSVDVYIVIYIVMYIVSN